MGWYITKRPDRSAFSKPRDWSLLNSWLARGRLIPSASANCETVCPGRFRIRLSSESRVFPASTLHVRHRVGFKFIGTSIPFRQ